MTTRSNCKYFMLWSIGSLCNQAFCVPMVVNKFWTLQGHSESWWHQDPGEPYIGEGSGGHWGPLWGTGQSPIEGPKGGSPHKQNWIWLLIQLSRVRTIGLLAFGCNMLHHVRIPVFIDNPVYCVALFVSVIPDNIYGVPSRWSVPLCWFISSSSLNFGGALSFPPVKDSFGGALATFWTVLYGAD